MAFSFSKPYNLSRFRSAAAQALLASEPGSCGLMWMRRRRRNAVELSRHIKDSQDRIMVLSVSSSSRMRARTLQTWTQDPIKHVPRSPAAGRVRKPGFSSLCLSPILANAPGSCVHARRTQSNTFPVALFQVKSKNPASRPSASRLFARILRARTQITLHNQTGQCVQERETERVSERERERE